MTSSDTRLPLPSRGVLSGNFRARAAAGGCSGRVPLSNGTIPSFEKILSQDFET